MAATLYPRTHGDSLTAQTADTHSLMYAGPLQPDAHLPDRAQGSRASRERLPSLPRKSHTPAG